MKNRILILAAVLLLLPLGVRAQWRVGFDAGATYNEYSMDKQYMTDYRFQGGWSYMLGVNAQYNFTDWLGVRADLDFVQRAWRHTRSEYAQRLDYNYRNNYLLLPVMASFSFGGRTVRGFANLGLYGGFWLSSGRYGQEFNSVSGRGFGFSESIAFIPEKDQRWDVGYAGGLGVEWQFASHWSALAEARGYYSVVSAVKPYMTHVQDYRYNSTIALQAGVRYIF